MDRLKRIARSAMADRSSRFMLATIALGVVVALLAGTLIGYKLDNGGGGSSGSTAKKGAATTAAAAAARRRRAAAARRNGKAAAQPVLYGQVVSARPAKIVVVGVDNKRVPLVIGAGTKAETASVGTTSNIYVGSHVMYAPGSGGTSTASEIVVLPATSGLGATVTAVTSTTMTLNGSVIKTTGATVLRTTASNRARIPNGAKVAVAYFSLRGKNGAVEVALLPATSKL